MMTKDSIYWIKEPAQIRALESPMRQEMVDALAANGPSSILELAEHLGRAPDSLYFHIRKLVKVKLILELEKRKSDRNSWVVYALPGRQMRIVYSPAAMNSIKKVVAGAARLSLREFGHAVAQKTGEFTGPQRNLWGGRTKGWLSESDLKEVNQLMERILKLMNRRKPGPGLQLHSLNWVLAPSQVRDRAPNPSAKKKGKK